MPFLYRTIMSAIMADIQSGQLRLGDKVPSELELAAAYGVSRITAKRAMEEMNRMGLVERFRGKDTFIADGATARASWLDADGTKPVVPSAGTVRRIGFVTPDISDLFGDRMLEGIEQTCREHDIDLSLRFSGGAMEVELETIRWWRSHGLDGIIVFPAHGEVYNDQLLRAVLDRFPIVLVDRHLVGVPAPSVMTDHYAACHELTRALLHQGHRSLVFVSPTALGTSSLLDRHRAFLDAIETHGPIDLHRKAYRFFIDSSVPGLQGKRSREDEIESLRQYLEEHGDITAVVASESSIALLITEVISRSPSLAAREIQIAGFDLNPKYTGMRPFPHVQQDEYGIGSAAVMLMLRLIDGEHIDGRHMVPHQLVGIPAPSALDVGREGGVHITKS